MESSSSESQKVAGFLNPEKWGGDSPRRGTQNGKAVFKIDLRRDDGRKLDFSLISLKKGQTLEKVSLFQSPFFF
jgi:hypothetical protein